MKRLFPGSADESGDLDLEVAYAYPATAGRWLRANMVATVDGAIAGEGAVSAGISSPADKRVFGALRQLADVVLVGAGTVRAEGYRPAKLPIAIVSGRLDLDFDSPLLASAEHRTIVLTAQSSPAHLRARAAEGADVVVCGDEHVDLAVALDVLEARGCTRLLTEGGPSLLGRLVDEDLLDELCLTSAPLLVGGDGPGLLGSHALHGSHPLRLTDLFLDEGFLFSRYSVVR